MKAFRNPTEEKEQMSLLEKTHFIDDTQMCVKEGHVIKLDDTHLLL